MTLVPEVLAADPASPEASALLAALNRELRERYPDVPEDHLHVAQDELAPGVGAFVVARSGTEIIGCGALRRRDAETGELKRMYVAPQARGAGLGRRIIAALEEHARELGMTRLVLETGDRQPEAVALYLGTGFAPIEPFAEYAGQPWSRCFGKSLERVESAQTQG